MAVAHSSVERRTEGEQLWKEGKAAEKEAYMLIMVVRRVHDATDEAHGRKENNMLECIRKKTASPRYACADWEKAKSPFLFLDFCSSELRRMLHSHVRCVGPTHI